MEEIPFEDRVVPKTEMDWGRSFWWWYPISLLLSVIAILLLRLGWDWGKRLFSADLDMIGLATLSLDVQFASRNVSDLLSQPGFQIIPALTLNNIAFMTFLIMWVGLIAGLFGGILSRRAAVELGQRTIAPWLESTKLVVSRLLSYLWAAGMHIAAVAGLLIPVLMLGWFSRLGSWAATVAGVVLLVICIPLIFSIGRLFLSLLFGFPLSVCAISIEKKADAFEGFSRSNAYLFQRPVVAALCILMLALFGEIGAFLVSRTVMLGWGFIHQAFAASSGSDPTNADYLRAGSTLASSLVMAYRFSYFWAAVTGLYLVLRKCVDNTSLDEMEVHESELLQNPPVIPNTSQALAANNGSSSSNSPAEAEQRSGDSDSQ
jgi:hypothetical protein